MAFLEIQDLVKRFGPVHVLKGINLAVEEGGFLVLVGPSGCGKSTLLNTIAGLETVSKATSASTGGASTTCAPPSGTSPWCSSPMRSTRT